MEAAGLGLGVIGLAAQLYTSALRGYELLDTASSVGTDMGKFTWRLRTEQLRLKAWGDTWNIGDAEGRKTNNIGDETYRLVIITLARLTAVLLDVEQLRACYGISGTVAPGKRKGLRRKIAACFGKKPPPPQIPDLNESLAALENQTFIGDETKNTDIAAEMVQLAETAAAVKETLPAMTKIRWAVFDKDKSESLVQDVREYNEALYQLLPLPSKFATLESKIHYKAFSVPFPRNTVFTGREDVLGEVHAELMKDEPARLAVHGMGGVGKTQLMVEYAHRYRSSFSSIYWIRASRTTTLRADFAEIAVLTGLAQDVTSAGMQQAAITKVKDWLDARESGKWLIIFDNGDDVFESPFDSADERGTPLLKQILKLLPNRGCSVITTRDKRALRSRVAKVGIELGVMDEDDAKRLFFERWMGPDHFSSPREETLVGEIVVKLGLLPLAVDQAASYMHESKITLDVYISRIDAEPDQSLQQSSVDPDQYSASVAKTWELSISFIDDKFPVAGQLFRLLAFFDNEAMSESVVSTGLFRHSEPGESQRPAFPDPPENLKSKLQELDDVEHYGRALDALDALSLARRNVAGKTVWVHGLVHQWMRFRMQKLERVFWSTTAVETIGHAGDFGVFPKSGSTEPTFHLFIESTSQIDDIRADASKIYSHRTTKVLLEAPDYFISSRKTKKALISLLKSFIPSGCDSTCGDLFALCITKILYQSDHVLGASDKYSDLWTESLGVLQKAAALIVWGSLNGPTALTCRMIEQFHDTLQLLDMEESSLKVLSTILSSLRSQTQRDAPEALKALAGDFHAVIGRILMEEGEHRKAALILRSAIRLLQEAGLTNTHVYLEESITHFADCLSVLGRPQTHLLASQFKENKFQNVDALIRAFEAEGKRAQAEGLYAQSCIHAANVIRKFLSRTTPYESTGYGDSGGKLAASVAARGEWDFAAALFSFRLKDYELDVAAWARRDPSAPVTPGRILSWKSWRETVEGLCQCLEEGNVASADNLKLCRDRARELYDKVSNASSRGYWIGLEDVVAREEAVASLAGARRTIHDQFPLTAVTERVGRLVEDVEAWLKSMQENDEDQDAEYYLEIEAEMMEEESFRLVEEMALDVSARVRVEQELWNISDQLSEALQ